MASIKGGPRHGRSKADTFGKRLRRAREAAGLTAAEAADRMEVSLSAYYSWESDDRTPRDLVGLARVVRTSIGALYGERAA
jgi:transcriptional regulator with XRE-family HTH domain